MQQQQQIINESPIDLTFCYEAIVIIQDAIEKLEFISSYTYSNSANAISLSIGNQIRELNKTQKNLEDKFDEKIIEKSKLKPLLDQEQINKLVVEIKTIAKKLKELTSDICKSLDQTPDIPANLRKAVTDKMEISGKLNLIIQDLINAKFENFEEIITDLKKKNINLKELREKDMFLVDKLKKLNEELAKEETEYAKDTKVYNNKLLNAKKKLSQTLNEKKMLKDFREAELRALKILKETNFDNEQERVKNMMKDKDNERKNEIHISKDIVDYLKGQIEKTEIQQKELDAKKLAIEQANEDEKKHLEGIKLKKMEVIENYKKEIEHFEAEISNFTLKLPEEPQYPPMD